MKIIITLCLSLLFLNCGSQKETAKEAEETTENVKESMDNDKRIAEGYIPGIIRNLENEDGCPYVIEVENPDGNYMLDPLNLEDASFKKEGMKVWFKFTGLRIMNRCPKASPISLNDIQKRAE